MKINRIDLQASIHFIGIGGSGMCPLAALARKKGYTVTGSDSKCSKLTDLEGLGIHISYGHSAKNIEKADIVICSSAISSDNIEIQSAKKNGTPIYHRSELLSFFAEEKSFLSIAGTHGKTTTAAILSFILHHLKLDPDAVVGGLMKHSNTAWINGEGKYFVGEADESDGTFQIYSPEVAVVTNVDLDHMDFYRSKERLYSAFETYVNNTKANGSIVAGIDSPDARRLFDQYPGQKLSFGLSKDADVCAFDLGISENIQTFKIKINEKVWTASLKSLAKHDLLNTLAALSVVSILGLDIKLALKHLVDFPGVSRRLDPLIISKNLKLIDDYAHNPGKIRASIRACRRAWPDHSVRVVFEPHRYSRIDSVYSDFCDAFSEADEVFVTNVFSAGEKAIEKHTPQNIAKNIEHKSLVRTAVYTGATQLVSTSKATQKEKAVILFIGAGDSQKLAFDCKRHILAEIPTKIQ